MTSHQLRTLDRELSAYLESMIAGVGRSERRLAMGLYLALPLQLGMFREHGEKPQRSFPDLALEAQRLRKARQQQEDRSTTQ